jgi:hypothetical protein
VKHLILCCLSTQAWQDDPTKPIASAFGHFMLRQTPDADEE